MLVAGSFRPNGSDAVTLIVDDFSGLNPTRIAKVVTPRTVSELQKLVLEAQALDLPLVACGQRHSQGGHALYPGAMLVDMRLLNAVLEIDLTGRTLRVQAGITWAGVQRTLDPMGLAVAVMQSAQIFTVGGSVCVNAHGSDPRYGPLVDTVIEIVLVVADGRSVKASRTQHRDLFWAACGGYGLIGIIVEVVLVVTLNDTYRQRATLIATADYPSFLANQVLSSPGIGLHWGRLSLPPSSDMMDQVLVVTCEQVEDNDHEMVIQDVVEALSYTGAALLSPFGLARQPDGAEDLVKTLDPCDANRSLAHRDPDLLHQRDPDRWDPIYRLAAEGMRRQDPVHRWTFWPRTVLRELVPWTSSRNSLMQHPVGFLEYHSPDDADVLQSYLVPFESFSTFVDVLRKSLSNDHAPEGARGDQEPSYDRGPRVLFTLVRPIRPESRRDFGRMGTSKTCLCYATSELIEIVLHLNHGKSQLALTRVQRWTCTLIDAALALGGTYYLPVRNVATRSQFRRAYPRAGRKRLMAVKRMWDPSNRFRNQFADCYLFPTVHCKERSRRNHDCNLEVLSSLDKSHS